MFHRAGSCAHPPDLNTQSNTKPKQNNKIKPIPITSEISSHSSLLGGGLAASSSEATGVGTAFQLHIPVVLLQPGIALAGVTFVTAAWP